MLFNLNLTSVILDCDCQSQFFAILQIFLLYSRNHLYNIVIENKDRILLSELFLCLLIMITLVFASFFLIPVEFH